MKLHPDAAPKETPPGYVYYSNMNKGDSPTEADCARSASLHLGVPAEDVIALQHHVWPDYWVAFVPVIYSDRVDAVIARLEVMLAQIKAEAEKSWRSPWFYSGGA